jgi:hypothetical protein
VIPGGLYRGNDSRHRPFGVRATLVIMAATPDDVAYLGLNSELENFEGLKSHTRRSRISTGEKWHAQRSPPTPIRVLSARPQSRPDVNESVMRLGPESARVRSGPSSRACGSSALRPIAVELWILPVLGEDY